MGPVAKVMVILAISSLAYTLTAKGAQTANILGVGFKGLSGFAKVTQGRG